jgi:hypothetical protein
VRCPFHFVGVHQIIFITCCLSLVRVFAVSRLVCRCVVRIF